MTSMGPPRFSCGAAFQRADGCASTHSPPSLPTKGSYNTLIDAHEAIRKWVEANGYRIVGPSRELYLHNTMPIRHDDPSYVTEIQFPVEKALHTS